MVTCSRIVCLSWLFWEQHEVENLSWAMVYSSPMDLVPHAGTYQYDPSIERTQSCSLTTWYSIDNHKAFSFNTLPLHSLEQCQKWFWTAGIHRRSSSLLDICESAVTFFTKCTIICHNQHYVLQPHISHNVWGVPWSGHEQSWVTTWQTLTLFMT